MLELVADNVALVKALEEESAVVVGHDRGATIAATSSLTRPDIFHVMGLLGVPVHPGRRPPSEVFARMSGGGATEPTEFTESTDTTDTTDTTDSADSKGERAGGPSGPGAEEASVPSAAEEFYVSYFQQPGRAEAETEPDVRGWLAGFYAALSADTMPGLGAPAPYFVARGGTLRERFPAGRRPAWLTERGLGVLAGEFERSGLTGALNRYRNMDRDWADLAGYARAPVTQPSLFIGGALDASLGWPADAVKAFPETLPGLRGSHVLDGCGHFVQQERPEETNRILLDWLAALPGRP